MHYNINNYNNTCVNWTVTLRPRVQQIHHNKCKSKWINWIETNKPLILQASFVQFRSWSLYARDRSVRPSLFSLVFAFDASDSRKRTRLLLSARARRPSSRSRAHRACSRSTQAYNIKSSTNVNKRDNGYLYHMHTGMMRHIKASVRLHKWIRNSTSGYFRVAETARARNRVISAGCTRIKALNEVNSSSFAQTEKVAIRAFALPGDQQPKPREVITTNRERFSS